MKKSRILFIGQLPPLQHGVTKVNSYAKKTLEEKYLLNIINLSSSKNLDEIDKFSITKIFNTIILFLKVIYFLTKKPSLVYFSFCPSGFAFYRDVIITFFIRIFRIKHVFHMHGQGLNKRNSKIRILFEKYAFKKAYVIHLSSIFWNEVDGLVPEERFFVIPNSTDELYSTVETSPKTNDIMHLLYLSNYVRGKGPLYVLKLAEELWQKKANVQITMAGGWFDAQLKQEIESWLLKRPHLTVSGFLKVSGPVYGEEKTKLFHAADIFLFPSYIDTFPLAVVEALSAGKAIVAFNCGAVPEILENGSIGEVVNMHDTDEFLHRIEQLTNNPERIAELNQLSRQAYLKKYIPAQFEKNLLEVIDKVMN